MMTDGEELAWERGRRAAWVSLLSECLLKLGYDSPECKAVGWIAEREAAIAALRGLCDDFGDQEWDANLSLGSIIEKHLANHLCENCEDSE